MTKQVKSAIVYTHRGKVERGNGKPGYDWHEGYSETTPEGHVCYPWMTRRECIQDAKQRNGKAQFDEIEAALTARTHAGGLD